MIILVKVLWFSWFKFTFLKFFRIIPSTWAPVLNCNFFFWFFFLLFSLLLVFVHHPSNYIQWQRIDKSLWYLATSRHTSRTPGWIMIYLHHFCSLIYCLDCVWKFEEELCQQNGQCQIASPGYPGIYPPNTRCRFHLQSSSKGAQIKVTFTRFNLPQT